MPDLFDMFRWLLALIVTVYYTVITIQSFWVWLNWLAGADRYIGLLRRYVLLHGLRLRIKEFWGDVIVCLLLCVVFVLLWRAHQIIYDIGDQFGKPAHASWPVQHV